MYAGVGLGVSPLWSSITWCRCSSEFSCLSSNACISSRNESSQRPHTSAKENLVRIRSSGYVSGLRIRTLHPDDFRNLAGTSLFKVTFVLKFSWRSDHFIQRYEPHCGKKRLSRNVEESFNKIPGCGSGGWRLPKRNQFFLVHRCICGNILRKIHSAVFM